MDIDIECLNFDVHAHVTTKDGIKTMREEDFGRPRPIGSAKAYVRWVGKELRARHFPVKFGNGTAAVTTPEGTITYYVRLRPEDKAVLRALRRERERTEEAPCT